MATTTTSTTTSQAGGPGELVPVWLRALGREWKGLLLDTPSGREVARHLPLELTMRRWLGAYAGRREQPLTIWLDPEPRPEPTPGDLAWWPGDSSLCVYLPPSMDEDPGRPRLPAEVNVIGRLEGDLAPLASAGHEVRIELAGPAEMPRERLRPRAAGPARGYGDAPAPAPIGEVLYAPGIHAGPAPDKRGIERLARRGFRSLLDLRTEGEPEEVLSPNVAATWAHAELMRHLRAQVSRSVLQPESVDRFLEQLARAPRPVYVHSGTGRRAAALLAIHLALTQDLGPAEALERLRAKGLDPVAHALLRFVETEVARRRSAPSPVP